MTARPPDPEDLLARDAATCWHPFTQHATAPPFLPIVRAEGAWLTLSDGRRVLDGISSWWSNLHGHGHPAIVEAIARQAAALDHVLFAGCTHEPGVALAERLGALAPPGLTRVFYSDDGSTSVEVALKMAYQLHVNRGQAERQLFVALEHGYHGDTLGAMAVGDPRTFDEPFGSLLFPARRVHGALAHPCSREPEVDVSVEAALARLAELLEREGERVAAVVVEPLVQGAGGMLVQPAAYLRGVRELASAHGCLLIADEVLTGFGRTGRTFACEHAGVTPDLLCVSKGLTGGVLPLAATLASEATYEAFLGLDARRAFLHGHTYTGNPIACAAALASLDLLDTDDTRRRLEVIESVHARRLSALAGHPAVASVRWLGTIGAVELRGGAGSYHDGLGPALAARFLARGVLLRPLGRVIYVLPPYVVTEPELDLAHDAIAAELDAVAART